MVDTALRNTGEAAEQPDGLRGVVSDWASDQRAFKSASWGKAMMWIALLHDRPNVDRCALAQSQ